MSLPKYVVNFNNLTDDLKKKILELIDDELRGKYPQLNTNDIEALLEYIKELLPSVKYKKLKNKIDDLIYVKHDGMQKIDSKLLDIPPIMMENKEDFIFDKDIFLTGLHFNQTGWKKEDTFDLIINKEKIIDNASIKEIGEHKYFNTFYKVNANTPISFILNNNSGNSRQVMLDLEYLSGTVATVVVEPEVPSIDDIPNDWDVAIVMQWEANTPIDVDLHAFIEDKHICFWHKKHTNFYLNFDYIGHIDNNNPEIISVKGYKNKKLDVYLNNYSRGVLTEPVNVKIYNKRPYGNKLLKEFNVNLEADNKNLYGVCTVDLNTLKITDLDKTINILGGK